MSTDSTKLSSKNLQYKIVAPGETFETSKFTSFANKHDFPSTEIGNTLIVNVTYYSLPRTSTVPTVECLKCALPSVKRKTSLEHVKDKIWDDRMHTSCTMKGKHRCEDFEEDDAIKRSGKLADRGKENLNAFVCSATPSTSNSVCKSTLKVEKTENIVEEKRPKQRVRKLGLIPDAGSDCLQYSFQTPNQQIACSETGKIDFICDKIRQQNAKNHKYNDLTNQKNKGQILLDAILRSGKRNTTINCENREQNYGISNIKPCGAKAVQVVENHSLVVSQESANAEKCASDSNTSSCDNLSESDIFNIKNKTKYKIYDDNCDNNQQPILKYKKMRDISNINLMKTTSKPLKNHARRILFDDCHSSKSEIGTVQDENEKDAANLGIEIPTALEQAKFRKNLDSAASMVFHSRTGLPLTSSPAPVRRGKSCFDFDSSINSVSAIKR